MMINQDLTGATILLVGVSSTSIDVIPDYLETQGVEVISASNGRDCLDIASQRLPNIILLDAIMPELDEFETCRRLKANEGTRNIPVIFMTALADSKDKHKIFKAGADDYITKPILLEALLARIKPHLRVQQQVKRLKSQQEKLAICEANKHRLIYSLVFDIKAKHQPLLGNLELLVEEADSLAPIDQQMIVESAFRSSKQIHEIIENLTEWTAIQTKINRYLPESLSLNKIVQDVVKAFDAVVTEKEINLTSTLVANFQIYAEAHRIEKTLRRLIDNAIKFTPKGGQIAIEAQLVDNNNWVEVSITDTGVGISKENQQKLFQADKFITGTSITSDKVSGLSLLICNEVTKKYNGQIWVESELGQGTTVKFTIPSVSR